MQLLSATYYRQEVHSLTLFRMGKILFLQDLEFYDMPGGAG